MTGRGREVGFGGLTSIELFIYDEQYFPVIL